MKKGKSFVRKFIAFGFKYLSFKYFISSLIASFIAILIFFQAGLIKTNASFQSYENTRIDTCAINKVFIKNQLVAEVNSYIKQYAPKSKIKGELVVDKCLSKNFDICLLLAQAHLESNFGTRGRAIATNSIFGVGHYDDGQNRVHYKTADEAIDKYIELMVRSYLKSNPPIKALKKGLKNKYGADYASNPEYETKLISRIREINREFHIYKFQLLYKKLDGQIM